jgi:hypothetical protein
LEAHYLQVHQVNILVNFRYSFSVPTHIEANDAFVGQSRDHECREKIAALIITREQEVASVL